MVEMRKPADFYSEPVIVVGAGIVAGFVYWAVAGWSAGFWKPVFAQPPRTSRSAEVPQWVRAETENAGIAVVRQIARSLCGPAILPIDSLVDCQRRGSSARAPPPSSRSAKAAMVLA